MRAIEDQARVLEGLRSRASTLVAAAALVTGFLGGETLARADAVAVEPISWAGFAIASFVATAACTFAILGLFRGAIVTLSIEVAAWMVALWRL